MSAALALGLALALVPAATANAAIAFRSAASRDQNGSAGSITINVPTGTLKGDVMIAVIAVRPYTVTITAPGGFTLVDRQDNPNGNTNVLAVYRRVASSSEPASYTWSFSSNTGNAGGILSFSGVDNPNPIDASGGVLTTSSSTSINAPSVTTTVADTMIVTGHEYASSRRWTPPSGMAEAFDVASLAVNNAGGIATVGSYKAQAAIGATGTLTATTSGDADTGAGITVALRPVVCGPAVSDPSYFAANAQSGTVILYWSSPDPVIVLRKTTPFGSEAPAAGVTYVAGEPIGAATVVYAGSGTSTTQTGLTNGTTYYYKIFAQAGTPCYSPGTEVQTQPMAGPAPAWGYTMAGGSMLKAGIAGTGTLYTSSNASQVISLDTAAGTQSWPPVATTAAVQGWLTWLPSGSPGLKSLQTGTATMPVGSTASAQTVNVPITAVDTTRAILFFSLKVSSVDPGDGQVRGQLTSPTNIQFTRANDTSLSAVTIRWYLAEFGGGVRVQRGTASVTSSSSVSISAVDLTKSFVLISCSVATGDTTYGSDDFFRARLAGATNLEIVHNTTAVKDCDWQVVEYQASVVQRGTGTLSSAATSSGPISIASVDLATSFLQVTWTSSGNGSGVNSLQAQLTSATTIQIDRAVSGTTIDYAWEVVSLTDGTRIQRGTEGFGTATTSSTDPLSAVDLSRAVPLISTYQRSGQTAYSADDNVGPGWFMVTITNPTTVTMERQLSGSTSADMAWFVLEFPSGGAPVVLGGDQSGRVYSINTVAGAKNWEVALTGADAVQAGVAAQLRGWSDPAFQAAHADDLVFSATRNASTTNNKVFAQSGSDGTVQWTFNDTGVYAVDYVVGMPWVDYARNRLYVASRAGSAGTQPSLWVINTLDGTLVQSFTLGHLETSPTLDSTGNTLYVGNTGGELYALDTTALTLKWSAPAALGTAIKGFVWEHPSMPGLLYFSTADGNVWSVQDPGPGSPPDAASPVWKRAVAGPSTPLVLDKVYVGSSDGKVHQLNLATGVDEKQFTVGDGTATVGDSSTEDGTQLFVGTTAGALYKIPLPLP